MPYGLQHVFENNPGFEKLSTGLEDGPETVYMTLDGKKLYVFVNGHIVCFTGSDWKWMNERELKESLDYAMEIELAWRREAERVKNGGTVPILCKECRIPLQKHPFTGYYTCFVHGKK